MAAEHSLYTWDPVSQAWVHERGPEIPPPPQPPDVHALQSYFFDEDGKQWIRTVLAPMGRELAAKWEGAHKVPDDQLKTRPATAKAPAKKKQGGSPVAVIAIAVVLLVLLGGAGVVASQNGMLGQVAPESVANAIASIAPTPAPIATAAPSPSASASPSPTATAAPVGGGGGGGGGGVVRTPTPAGAQVTQPPGSSQLRLSDGTTVYYNGPTLAIRNTQLPASLVVAAPNGRAAVGVITVVLGDQRGSTQAQGIIDSAGHVVINVPATQPSGQYPLSVLYNNQLGQVTLITVR